VEEFLTSAREDRTYGFEISAYRTVDGEHGRIEARRYWQATAPDFLPEKAEWRDLKSVGMVEATREINGQETTEVRYYLSSLPVKASEFGRAVRSHWGIENSCHWVLCPCGNKVRRSRVIILLSCSLSVVCSIFLIRVSTSVGLILGISSSGSATRLTPLF
jgi:predicted transposase YbfD/YdcC